MIMSAQEMQLLGIVLILAGIAVLLVSQLALIRWHNKVLREM